jgi:hypothetical protein
MILGSALKTNDDNKMINDVNNGADQNRKEGQNV